MPQYAYDPADANAPPRLIRARDAVDAACRALGITPDALAIDDPDDQGWQSVRVDGTTVGRFRLHQRMRFRRD